MLRRDFNEDGWTDVYVANDGDANQLWINERGTGVFRDEALLAGVAVSRTGQAQGSMGIDPPTSIAMAMRTSLSPISTTSRTPST